MTPKQTAVAALSIAILGAGVGMGLMRSAQHARDDAKAEAASEHMANDATRSMLALLTRERAIADTARAHQRVTDSVAAKAAEIRGRFTPSPLPHSVTYTVPGTPPATLILPDAVFERFAADSLAIVTLTEQVRLEHAGRVLAEQASASARVALTAKDTIIAVEKRNGKRQWWRGAKIGAGVVALGVLAAKIFIPRMP